MIIVKKSLRLILSDKLLTTFFPYFPLLMWMNDVMVEVFETIKLTSIS